MFNKNKNLLGANIPHSCDYCQNCVVEGGKNFCIYKKSINKKGKCSRFYYNPVMRKVAAPKPLDKFDVADFTI